ncbi:sigma 54-interacting transcriptional regulator [Clostridium sp. YIM B02551]|uniref:sigma 54-interacting transcriptional regulator n=1 Tax=Clostridium sp. YIM B02551 TaxID=2910679 RepID=UPI001EECAF2A|nr:sigma-54-dependent transcriptional regulator [Clostridium sp. YIM B02551]
MKRIDKVYKTLYEFCLRQYKSGENIIGISAIELSKTLEIQRTNASSDLNKLYSQGRVEKIEGKPVLYKVLDESIFKHSETSIDVFENVLGASVSLRNSILQAKSAIVYPPDGLHTILLGETGTGKSMFAETMFKYAKEIGKFTEDSPFVTFNCADYSNNPQLLMAQLFGVKKGSYTGADKDRDGLIEKANGGILFLDEVHRLPPEGQEMLFYIIDKGVYRKLGETQVENSIKVLIICATTENTQSGLLKTFTRRIPMTIKLPSLRERSLEERYDLIKTFLKNEAKCIKTDITVTSNTLKALLLYDCPNNIGQLKSDIKLCCAKAFLNNMLNREESLYINSQDLPDYIIKGALKYKNNKEEVDKFLNEDALKFTSSGINTWETEEKSNYNFYDALEEKKKVLETKGMNEKDIKLIMSLDMDRYLKKYILTIGNDNLEELYKVVDKKVVSIIDRFLKEAERKLNRKFNNKILYGLSMHIVSTIERIKTGRNMENHQLEDIKYNYKKEFEIANVLKESIECYFNVILSEDEVGFITMFLCMDNNEVVKEEKVGVVVAMHGESAATSIVDVANRLLGENHAIGYNMPLDQKPEVALENLMDIVRNANKGNGVILLVDMGSLVFFGDMISEKTKIPIKSVDMVSTLIVLEATRKALLNYSLEEIYDACTSSSPYKGKIYKESYEFNERLKNNVIVTACITGQGAALKLKDILEQKLNLSRHNIDVIPIEITDSTKFKRNIEKIKKNKNVIGVVSASNPKDREVIYLSTSDIFKGEKINDLSEVIALIQTIDSMQKVIEENTDINSSKFIEGFRKFIIILRNNNVQIGENPMLGLILHIACAIERVLKNEKIIHINSNGDIVKKNMDKINLIRDALESLESSFGVKFPIEEYANIVKIAYYL